LLAPRTERAGGRAQRRRYRVPRDQLRIAMLSSWPDALAGADAPGAPL
jgi:hypothetical protein